LKKHLTYTHFALLLILGVAAALRLYGLADFSYSNDELSALYRLRFDSFSDLIKGGVQPDFHPAGVQAFLYYWTALAGSDPFWVRLPFALMGVGSVYLVYLCGKGLYGPASGLFAAALMASFSFPLLYSRLARPYATGLFFILLLIWIWLKLWREPPGNRSRKGWLWAGLTLSFAGAMYNHYFSFLMAAIIGVFGLWVLKKQQREIMLLSGLTAAAFFLPHLSITLAHFSIGGLSTWLGPPSPSWPLEHWNYIFNSSAWFSLPLALLLGFALFRRYPSGILHPGSLLLLWIILLGIGYFYSLFVNPVLQHSILIFSLPLLVLALSAGLSKLKPPFAALLSVCTLLAGTLHTIGVGAFYRQSHFADFQAVAQSLDAYRKSKPEAGMKFVLNANNRWYYDFYSEDSLTFLMEDIRNLDSLGQLRRLLDTLRCERIAYLSLKPEPPETKEVLLDYFPEVCLFDAPNQYSWMAVLSRADSIQAAEMQDARLATFPFTLELALGEEGYWHLPDDSEFSPVLRIPLPGKEAKGSKVLHARAFLCWDSGEGDPQLVGTAGSETGGNLMWRASPARVFMDPGRCGPVHLKIKLPEDMMQEDSLSCYLWSPGGHSFTLKYLTAKISLEE
jgi:hypothetical protein